MGRVSRFPRACCGGLVREGRRGRVARVERDSGRVGNRMLRETVCTWHRKAGISHAEVTGVIAISDLHSSRCRPRRWQDIDTIRPSRRGDA